MAFWPKTFKTCFYGQTACKPHAKVNRLNQRQNTCLDQFPNVMDDLKLDLLKVNAETAFNFVRDGILSVADYDLTLRGVVVIGQGHPSELIKSIRL